MTFGELKRAVFLRMQDSTSGKTLLAVEQAINEAHMVIADVQEFDELKTTDKTHAATVASKYEYHITSDLALVRPKDIYTIRVMADASSRKLDYVSAHDFDTKVPYPEIAGEDKPTWYTRKGLYVQLYRIPDAVYPLYIYHSQWPVWMTADSETSPFLRIDHVIIALATDIAIAIIAGTSSDWTQRAKALLGLAINEDDTRPDNFYIARPFQSKAPGYRGTPWNNPFVKE